MASGCTGCDGKPIYATITKVLTGVSWTDGVNGVIIEDPGVLAWNAANVHINAYAFYTDKAPRKLADGEWTLTLGDLDSGLTATNVAIDNTHKTISIQNMSEPASTSDIENALLIGALDVAGYESIDGAQTVSVNGSTN